MANQENTRIVQGSTIAVDDLADGWITAGNIISWSGFGAAKALIDISSAADPVDQAIYGLLDSGDATIEINLDMDDDFQEEMETMYNSGETRAFKVVMPEGTLNSWTFDAYVLDQPIVGAKNNVWKLTLTLTIVTDITDVTDE